MVFSKLAIDNKNVANYEASDFYLGGTNSHWTRQPSLDTQPDVNLSTHPAPIIQTICHHMVLLPPMTPPVINSWSIVGKVTSQLESLRISLMILLLHRVDRYD
jgi:hypothetical protein